MNEAQKTPAGTRSAFETSPLKRAAALIAAGNQRNAEKEREQMSRRAEPKAGFVRMSRAAELLNAAGNHKLPLNGLEIASFNRAKLDPTTSAPTAPTAPKATSKATTAATKAKLPLTLAQKIARLTPEARAALKARLDAFNAGKPKATATKSKPTVEAVTKPMKATVKPAAVRPAGTPAAVVKVSKGSRWSVALGKLANLSLGRAAL
jgi:hypothetical protein